jgi:hypothetical protein
MTESGDPVPGGEHVTEDAAKSHMAALYANVEDAGLKKNLPLTGQPVELFIPLAKIDEEKRQVWGYGSIEEPDGAGEIQDYEASKPNWIAWSRSQHEASGGKSLGNVRRMHKLDASGRLISFQPDDQNKGIWVGAEIVDDQDWEKCKKGVYTGFSVGGSYGRTWYDPKLQKTRYEARPEELSLVDRPCINGAKFRVMKAAGAMIDQAFQAGGTGKALAKIYVGPGPDAATEIDVVGEPLQRIPTPNTLQELDPDKAPDGARLAANQGGVHTVEIEPPDDGLGKAAMKDDEIGKGQAKELPEEEPEETPAEEAAETPAEEAKEEEEAPTPEAPAKKAEEKTPEKKEEKKPEPTGKEESLKKIKVSTRDGRRLVKVRLPKPRLIKVRS